MNIPAQLTIFLAGLIPGLDVKLAVPLGLKLGLSPVSAIFFSSAGSIILTAIFLALIERIVTWGRNHSKKTNAIFKKIFQKTRKEHGKNFKRYGALFLILLVATPLPGSGGFTGALIAFLFKIDYWKALTLISIGVFLSAIFIVGSISSISGLFHLFA